nr:reverse transcriptase domain-containing protein [Tanacetum cinerariifolium]
MSEKFNREKEKNEKLKELKAWLNFEGCSGTSCYNQHFHSRYTEALLESEDSEGGHWKSRSKKKKSSREDDDLSQPWQKNYIKDLIELHNIKQRDRESIEDFIRRYKLVSRNVKGAPECIRIFRFVHEIPNSKLIKRLHDKISKTTNEMMRVTTPFLRGEVAASNHKRKKTFPPKRQHEGNQKQNFKKEVSRTKKKTKRKQDHFSLLTKTPREIFALDKGNFKAPPPMTTPVEKQNHAKFYEFHGKGGQTNDYIKFLSYSKNLFPPLEEDEGVEGPMIIEAEIEGHCVHRMDVLLLEKRKEDSQPTEQAIQEEVRKLIEVGIIREVHYQDWLSNLKMVKNIMRVGGNVGATYQRLVDKTFNKQIGKNLEVYIDDLVIKSRTEDEIVRDIEEMFKTLREINMKLNPKKCTFRVEEGMFLRALKGLELKYTSMEKLVLTLVHASKRLKRPRVSVKGKTLADFIVERPEEDSPNTPMEEEELPKPWILFTDGSSYKDGSGAGLILTNPEGMEFTYALRFGFDAINNEAEYEAFISELPIAEQIGVKILQENVDSHLVANQVNGTYVAKEADMIHYLEKVKALTGSFKAFSIKQIPRSENKKADALSKIASTSFAHLMSKDYFTKWIEAKLVATITGNQIKKFVWDNIFCRFGLPEEIISDNGKQFQDDPFKDWCEKLCIRQHFAFVKHPQTNGLMERANHSLGEGIKARLDTRSKNWMEELPHVLWAHRTMIKSSNEDTPFLLTYGTEAVIPAEIGMPTLRTTEVDLVGKNEALEINLGLLEERREEAAIRKAKSKAKMEKYYNSKV